MGRDATRRPVLAVSRLAMLSACGLAARPTRTTTSCSALCEAGRVDRLVTGDKADLLALERHGTARIVTAAGLAGKLGLSRD